MLLARLGQCSCIVFFPSGHFDDINSNIFSPAFITIVEPPRMSYKTAVAL